MCFAFDEPHVVVVRMQVAPFRIYALFECDRHREAHEVGSIQLWVVGVCQLLQ